MKTYNFKINGKDYSVTIKGIEGRNAEVSVNGTDYSVEMENAPDAVPEPAAVTATAAPQPQSVSQPAAPSGGVTSVVHSPLPGVIISVDVKEGQAVKKGQKVAVLEAMKME
ncbi:MAG: biotin/lipoyl-binding protein, partial [Bacteroidales bacterium]|nr:biotin/lipoyl-binding protein [Bacteroidales bacterium]